MASPTRRSRAESGFTLVELLVVVAIVGIIAIIAYPLLSRMFKRSKASEVNEMFGKFQAAEGTYNMEYGRYLGLCTQPPPAPGVVDSACTEADAFPAAIQPNGERTPVKDSDIPFRWKKVGVNPGKNWLVCQYSVVAGPSRQFGNMGTYGNRLFATKPTGNWYYMVARCNWDNDNTVNAAYFQRGDKSFITKDNEGN